LSSSFEGFSVARDNEANESINKFTHSICTPFNGVSYNTTTTTKTTITTTAAAAATILRWASGRTGLDSKRTSQNRHKSQKQLPHQQLQQENNNNYYYYRC